jgi:hypothetical protein
MHYVRDCATLILRADAPMTMNIFPLLGLHLFSDLCVRMSVRKRVYANNSSCEFVAYISGYIKQVMYGHYKCTYYTAKYGIVYM